MMMYLLLNFPQALHSAEHVAAPQQEAPIVISYQIVSWVVQFWQQYDPRCPRSGPQAEGATEARPCLQILFDVQSALSPSQAMMDVSATEDLKLASVSVLSFVLRLENGD